MAKIKKVKLGTEVYDIEPTNTVPLSDVAVTSVAGKNGDVTLTKSDVGLGNVGNFKAVSTVAGQSLTSTEKSNARANIGAGTSSLTLGTTATTAAKGNHTHTTTIATSSATNELTLAHGTKYAITAGGDSFVFTMPSDNNTNTSHSHSAGVGLVGSGSAGTSGGTYNYKAKLRSETALTVDSAAATTTSGRVYPVAVDKSGYLSVNVPWTDTNTDTNTWRKVQLNGTDKLGTGTNTNPLNIKAGKDMSITESSGTFTFNSETNFESIGTYSELGALKTTIAGGSYTRSQAFKCIIGTDYYYGFLNVIKNSSGTITGYDIIMWKGAAIYYLTYIVSNSTWTENIKYLSTTSHTHSTSKANAAPHSHTHSVTVSGTTGNNSASVTVASGSLSSTGSGGTVATGASGTATVVTGVSGGSGSLTSNTTSTDGIKYIETHTAASLGTASTADAAPHAHTHSFEFGGTTGTSSGSAVTALTGVKVSAQPSISLTANAATATGRIKYVESVTHTAASLGTASTGTVSISGGSYSGTTKYMKVSTTAADTGTVGISGGSGSLTSDTTSTNGIAYVAAQGTFSAGTTPKKSASFSGTAATITPTLTGSLSGTCLTLSITGASYTPAGSVSLTAGTAPSLGAATTKYLHHTHTAASLTGTTTFAKNGIKSVSLGASTTSTDGPAYVESISGSAPSLGGTKTFVTGYSSFSGGSITPITKYLSASASGTSVAANGTASVAPFEHSHNYSGSSTTASNSGGEVKAVIGYPNFSGGSGTTKYLHHTHTGASASGTTTAVTGISTSKLATTSAAKHTHTHSYGSSTALTTGNNSGSAVAAVTAVNSATES